MGLETGHACETLTHAHTFRQVFAILFVQQRLVIEKIELRRPTAHEEINDSFGFRVEMRRVQDSFERIWCCCCAGLAIEQTEQRHATEAECERSEEIPA